MQVGTFTTVNPNMSNTRTYEDFSRWIGTKPSRFGIVSRMFPKQTATYITEALGNVFELNGSKNKFQSINSLMYEWEIETNEIKRIEIVDTPIGDGANGSEITMAFRENYFQMNDTFEIENTRQQFFVVAGPTRKRDDYWELQVRILDNNYSTTLEDVDYVGLTARWIGNAFKKSNLSLYLHYIILVEALLGD